MLTGIGIMWSLATIGAQGSDRLKPITIDDRRTVADRLSIVVQGRCDGRDVQVRYEPDINALTVSADGRPLHIRDKDNIARLTAHGRAVTFPNIVCSATAVEVAVNKDGRTVGYVTAYR